MSGLDLLSRIQQEPRTADIPVIALAANRDQRAEIRCLRAGFLAFLGTPVGLEELYRTIQTAIEPVTRASLRVRTQMPVIVDNAPLEGVKGECALVISEHGMYIRTLKPHPPKRPPRRSDLREGQDHCGRCRGPLQSPAQRREHR